MRLDHRQIVADEQVGEAPVPLELVEQVQDLRLHRDVEGAGRLVEHDEVGIEREGSGDGDALPLPAGELVRVAVEVLASHADAFEQCDDPLGQLGPGGLAVDAQRPADDVLDQLAGIEGGEGILEHNLAVPAIRPPGLASESSRSDGGSRFAPSALALFRRPLLAGYREDVVRAQHGPHRRVGSRCRRRSGRVMPADAAAESGLSAAALADQAQRLAAADIEADTPSTARTWPTTAGALRP